MLQSKVGQGTRWHLYHFCQILTDCRYHYPPGLFHLYIVLHSLERLELTFPIDIVEQPDQKLAMWDMIVELAQTGVEMKLAETI